MAFRDQRVVNEYERPRSSDFNVAQSLSSGSLQQALHAVYTNGSFWSSPELISGVDGPYSLRISADLINPASVSMAPGMAFGYGPGVVNPDGISGVRDVSSSRVVVNSQTRRITLPTPPPAGYCRRDVIMVAPWSSLRNYQTTDIFNPTLQSFGSPVQKPKTFGCDLYEATQEVILPALPQSPESALVYLVGEQVAYSGSDDVFLTASIPTIPGPLASYYIPIAILNRRPTISSPLQRDIVDLRPVMTPGGNQLPLYIIATLGTNPATGSSSNVFNYFVNNGGVTQPRFLLRGLPDAGLNQLFELCVFGGMTQLARVNLSGGLFQQLFSNDYGQPLANPGTSPISIVPYSLTPRAVVDQQFLTQISAAGACPYYSDIIQWLAIGQPYTSIRFCLAKPVAQPTGELKLMTGANSFGIDSDGDPLTSVQVQLNCSWTCLDLSGNGAT